MPFVKRDKLPHDTHTFKISDKYYVKTLTERMYQEMGYVKALAIKFVAISVTVLSIYGIFDHVSLANLILISLLTTVITFLVGDLLILKRSGNLVASVSDLGLSFVTLWLLSIGLIGGDAPILTTSLLAAFFIAVIEPFVHEYMLHTIPDYKHVLDKREPKDEDRSLEFQTEFAEEEDVHDIRSDDDDYDGKKL